MKSHNRRRLGPAAKLLYGILFLIAAFEVGRSWDRPEDYRGFVFFGEAALAGQMPYDPEVEFAYMDGLWANWPPSFTPIAALLATADGIARGPSILLWQTLNLAALWFALAVYARWLYGLRLSLVPGEGKIPLFAPPVLAGLLVPFLLLLSNFDHTQSNLLILGLAIAGFWLFGLERRWLAGLALGLATAFKATPLLLLPYLAYRGRWRDLMAGLAGCAFAWIVLPAVLLGPGELLPWYTAWANRVRSMELPLSPMNQSLRASIARFASWSDVSSAPAADMLAASTLPGAETADALFWLAAAAVAVALLIAFGRPLRDVDSRRAAQELSVAFVAMTLFAPIAWKSHYVTLLPMVVSLAGTTLALGWRATSPPSIPRWLDRSTVLALALTLLVTNFTGRDLIGGRATDRVDLLGITTWPALALLIICLVHLRMTRARPSDGAETVTSNGRRTV